MIRTRFSPSPTGFLHLGNARTALFSALLSAHSAGNFILRIEDTDVNRSEERFLSQLLDDLHWLQINWQEGPDVQGKFGPYKQSMRADIYENYYKQLENADLVYPCFCTDEQLALNRKIQLSTGKAPRYPGTCRKLSKQEVNEKLHQGLKPALRFSIPKNKLIEFDDLIKGKQKFNSDDIGDFIIRRADGSASFMFCNAIDDSLMQVTQVLRGEDHLSNTPRQLMILQALNMTAPQYGHLSLIVGSDGTRLSKRHGSFSLNDLRNQGYLSNAVLNYLARLSHAYKEAKLYNFNELANNFSLKNISRAPARFDDNQLLFWQKEAVLALNLASMKEWLGAEIINDIPNASLEVFLEMMRHNILFPKDAIKWKNILFGKNLEFTDYNIEILSTAGEKFFAIAKDVLSDSNANLNTILSELKTTLNISGKRLFMPIRIALTGEEHGPELMQIALVLGNQRMQDRFNYALHQLRT